MLLWHAVKVILLEEEEEEEGFSKLIENIKFINFFRFLIQTLVMLLGNNIYISAVLLLSSTNLNSTNWKVW